jgi:hypothetical protein
MSLSKTTIALSIGGAISAALLSNFTDILNSTVQSGTRSLSPAKAVKNLILGKERMVEISYSATCSNSGYKAAAGMEHNHHLIAAVIDFLKTQPVTFISTKLSLGEPSKNLFGNVGKQTNDPKMLRNYITSVIPINEAIHYNNMYIVCSLGHRTKKIPKEDYDDVDKLGSTLDIVLTITSRTRSFNDINAFITQCYQDYLEKKAEYISNGQNFYFCQVRSEDGANNSDPEFTRYVLPKPLLRSYRKISPFSKERHPAFRHTYLSDEIILQIQYLIDQVNAGMANKAIFLIDGLPGSGKTTLYEP